MDVTSGEAQQQNNGRQKKTAAFAADYEYDLYDYNGDSDSAGDDSDYDNYYYEGRSDEEDSYRKCDNFNQLITMAKGAMYDFDAKFNDLDSAMARIESLSFTHE